MRLTISPIDGEIFVLDVPNETLVSGLKMLIGVEYGKSEDNFVLMKDGKLLPASDTSVLTAGLCENDLICLVPASAQHLASLTAQNQMRTSAPTQQPGGLNLPSRNVPATSASSPSSLDHTENFRQALLNGPSNLLSVLRERNPELAGAINDAAQFKRVFEAQQNYQQQQREEYEQTMNADPLDPLVQNRIAEMIRQRNIDEHMESALENFPESFAQVSMLFVSCKVRGQVVKAFVDSGAQSTIMSEKCAQRCQLERLIDKRWSGKAYGVGTQTILGRIHSCEMEIGGALLTTSFIVLKDQQLDLMLGLDMLKRHQCCVDLKRNVLTLDAGRVESPFLPESEIPVEIAHPERRSVSGPGSSVAYLTMEQKQKVEQLVTQGVPEYRAIQELQTHDWDVQAALVSFMSSDDAL